MNHENARFGLIGAGGIAQAYVQALPHSATAELVGVADVRPEAAASARRASRLPGVCVALTTCSTRPTARRQLFARRRSTHPEMCCSPARARDSRALRKAAGDWTRGGAAMVAAAERSEAQLTMASKFRYARDVVEAKSIVASGVIGDVVLFENAFTLRVEMKSRWNSDPTISGGGVLVDNGTHSVDILRYFLGPLVEIQVVEGRRVQDIPVEDTVRVFVRSAGGVMGSIDLSWSLNKELPYYISVYGSGGTLHVGWKESKFRRAGDAEWTCLATATTKCRRSAARSTTSSARSAAIEAPLITLADALASVEVIDAAYDAMWRATWVPISIPTLSQVLSAACDDSNVCSHSISTAIIEEGVVLGPGTSVWDNAHIRHGTRPRRRVPRRRQNADCLRRRDRQSREDQLGRLHLQRRDDRGRRDDQRRRDFHQRSLSAGGDERSVAASPSTPDEHTLPTLVREGATIGAGAIIGCDLTIGRFAMIGMGSVVTRSVPDFHLVIGNPARSIGCVCRCGQPLAEVERPGTAIAGATCGAGECGWRI